MTDLVREDGGMNSNNIHELQRVVNEHTQDIADLAGSSGGIVRVTDPTVIDFDTAGFNSGNGVPLGFPTGSGKYPLALVIEITEEWNTPPNVMLYDDDGRLYNTNGNAIHLSTVGQYVMAIDSTWALVTDPGDIPVNGFNLYQNQAGATAGSLTARIAYVDVAADSEPRGIRRGTFQINESAVAGAHHGEVVLPPGAWLWDGWFETTVAFADENFTLEFSDDDGPLDPDNPTNSQFTFAGFAGREDTLRSNSCATVYLLDTGRDGNTYPDGTTVSVDFTTTVGGSTAGRIDGWILYFLP